MKLRFVTAAVVAVLFSGAAVAGTNNTYPVVAPNLTDIIFGTHSYTGSGTGTTNNFTVQSVLGLLSSANVTTALGFTPAQNGANADITFLTGTTTNGNASAGNVGEFKSSNIASGSAVSLTTGTAADVTSVSLSAGDWDCRGTVGFKAGTGTVSTALRGWVGAASAAEPTDAGSGAHFVVIGQSYTDTTTAPILPTGMIRESLATTTTVYLGAAATFGTSTLSAYGFLGCRRAR